MKPRLLLGCLAAGIAMSGCAVATSPKPLASPPPGAPTALGRPHHHGVVALCTSGTTVRSLVVTRRAGYHGDFSFPATVHVGARGAARVVDAICSLPAAYAGIRFCPADVGDLYRLVFRTKGGGVAIVAIDPTGCASVSSPSHSIGTKDRVRAPNQHLWHVLGDAVGVHHATWQTFVGTYIKAVRE